MRPLPRSTPTTSSAMIRVPERWAAFRSRFMRVVGSIHPSRAVPNDPAPETVERQPGKARLHLLWRQEDRAGPHAALQLHIGTQDIFAPRACEDQIAVLPESDIRVGPKLVLQPIDQREAELRQADVLGA